MTRLFFQFWEIYWSLLLYLYAHYMVGALISAMPRILAFIVASPEDFLRGNSAVNCYILSIMLLYLYYHGRQPPDPENLRIEFFLFWHVP